MQLADAYRILGVAPGTPEPEARRAHDHLQLQWAGDRHHEDPELAYARRAELAIALDLIHRAAVDRRKRAIARIVAGLTAIVAGVILAAVRVHYVVGVVPIALGLLWLGQGLLGFIKP